MRAIADLLARVGPGLFQQAYVVDDLDAAMHAMRSSLGCGEFVTLPAMDLTYEYRGAPTECAIALAFGRSGNVQIELLHPERGDGLHVEFLRTNGPGAHHLGFMVDDLDAEIAVAGVAPVTRGDFGQVRFCYLDTWDALGLYVELVEDPDGLLMSLAPWR